jgi:hypothetical protein
MSVTYVAEQLSANGFDPTLPSGIKELSWPFDWIEGTFDDRHLFELTRAQLSEMWYRFRRFRVQWSSTGDNTLDFDFNMTRRLLLGDPITDEHDLRKPGMGYLHEATHLTNYDGAFVYESGLVTITGFDGNPSNTASIDATLNMFLKRFDPDSPFSLLDYPMHIVTGGDTWIPYFHLFINVGVSAASEYAMTAESTITPSAFEGSFAPSHGGGDFPLEVHSDGGDAFQPATLSLLITPNLWFEWGTKYDANTGLLA